MVQYDESEVHVRISLGAIDSFDLEKKSLLQSDQWNPTRMVLHEPIEPIVGFSDTLTSESLNGTDW